MKIAVIGNLHDPALQKAFGFPDKDRQSFYETFMERFFSIPADLYVSIGDLATNGSAGDLEKLHSLIRQYQKPFVHVFGHDRARAASGQQQILKSVQQDRFHMLAADHAILAFLDTTQAQDYGGWSGTLDPVQQQWLETVVVESGNRPLIVFGHHLACATGKPFEKKQRCLPAITPMRDLLAKKQGAGLYVNGHPYVNSIATDSQWTFLQLAPVLAEQAIRMINVSDSLISIDYVPFAIADEKSPALEKNSQQMHPLGTQADVKYAIPLPASDKAENSPNTREKMKIQSF